MENNSKIAKCKITFDGWDWANKVTVTSPSKREIHLNAHWGDNVSRSLKDLFTKWNNYWKDATYGSGTQKFEEELSYEIMQELLSLSNKKY